MFYDSDILHQLHNQLEAKLDSNLYLMHKIESEIEDPAACSASRGPYCKAVNNRQLSEHVADPTPAYTKVKNKHIERLKKLNKSIVENELKSVNTDIIYFDNGRLFFDEVLFPDKHSDFHYFTFTFETFNNTDVEKPFEKNVVFNIKKSSFKVHDHFLPDKPKLEFETEGLYMPAHR